MSHASHATPPSSAGSAAEEAPDEEIAGAGRGTLYLVASPIGNYEDCSPRAARILESVAVIAAEDTRETAMLLRHLAVQTRMVSCHDHNERERGRALIQRLLSGEDVALVSDAGTPLINDPGYDVVRQAIAAGIRVVPVPGPCAAITALMGAGLPTDRFTYLGFLPRQAGARDNILQEIQDETATLVLLEAPHRLLETLEALRSRLGERTAALGWNLTKSRETFFRGTLSSLIAELSSWEHVHGEATLVVGGAEEGAHPGRWAKAEAAIAALTEVGVEAKVIRDVVSGLCALPKREVYQRVLELRRARGD